MAKISLSNSLVDLLKKKNIYEKEIILITDDGGGKYSLQGGACTIGTKFTLITLDTPDPEYPEVLENDQGVHLWTSDYDLMFFNPGIKMDYHAGSISIKDDAHSLDNMVRIADGKEVLAAFDKGIMVNGATC